MFIDLAFLKREILGYRIGLGGKKEDYPKSKRQEWEPKVVTQKLLREHLFFVPDPVQGTGDGAMNGLYSSVF